MQNSKKNPFLTNKSCQESILFFILSIGLFIYSLTKHYGVVKLEWKMSPYLFPALISIFLFFLSILLFSDGLRQIKEGISVENDVKVSWKKLISAVIACMVYIIIMPIITFIPSTILFIGYMLYLLGERRKLFIIFLSILVSVIIYFLFSVLLNVMLP
ncbi:divalent metal cation (Fe/Co/Zn/Cd) transporter [Sedimentibacter acidaminivorans]|uniref:Divalent metal cation (Fe/Co/Zn/Cd) transporter n=1 Tax=Sedimentibacter acidaminivorans TaxID=913099 RepID=A0ABS4GAN1_9FIRM|nr:tripartite tricarboxylate transporter TctB family protein [Sedimentibacter acidaminivorans]MBP1924742.1 divalent metal cation (Fe/Co/Zn/Cd) transporter [Sedimentibacter acidaminivorans]